MSYKASLYNISFIEGSDYVIYNCLTNKFLVVNPAEKEIIQNVVKYQKISYNSTNERENDILGKLVKLGMLVYSDTNELKLVSDKLKLSTNTPHLFLTIALTPKCNFKCIYCFEGSGSIKCTMNKQEFENKLMSFISQQVKGKQTLSVDWYGGEPLIELDLLLKFNEYIDNICKCNNCKYVSSISTNGYLLTKDCLVRLWQQNSIAKITVCLDGPPAIHNKNRPLKNGQPSFDTILNNIVLAVEKFIVKVRINIDKKNYHTIDKLIEILDRKIPNKKNLRIIIKPVVFSRAGSQGFAFSLQDYARIEPIIIKKFLGKNYLVELNATNERGYYCIVYHNNQFMIDWSGGVHKCTDNFDIKEAIGQVSVTDGSVKLFDGAESNWLQYSRCIREECITCNVLPWCMGGCLFKKIVLNVSPCSVIRYNCQEYAKLKYLISRK